MDRAVELNDALKGLGKAAGDLLSGAGYEAPSKDEFSAPQKIDVFAEIEQQKIEAEGEAGRAVQQAIAEAQQMEAGKQRRLSTTPQLDATTPPVQGAPEVQPEQ